MKKLSGRKGHSPHWAALPEKIIIIIIINSQEELEREEMKEGARYV
jgi:hypothetical protein